MGKRLLEFQGISLGEPDEDPKVLIDVLAAQTKAQTSAAAPAIPQLPAYVHVDDMEEAATATRIPVGFAKRSIAPVFFDLHASPYLLVLGNDNSSIDRYLRGLREAFAQAGDVTYRFVDTQDLLAPSEPDANVLVDANEVEAFVTQLNAGELSCDVVVFTSVAQTMAALSPTASRTLQDYITNERGLGKTAFVCASELWRVRSIYDPWYKVISAYGNGIWVGSGFVDQTVFHFARALPEYRQPAARSDAFLTVRGDVTWVRLLEASDEPTDDE